MLKRELENSIVYNNMEDDSVNTDDIMFSFDSNIINNSAIVSPIIYNNIFNALEMDEINCEKEKFIHKLMLQELKNRNLVKINMELIIQNNKLRYSIVLKELINKIEMKEINKKLRDYTTGYRVWKSLLGEKY